MNTFQKQKMFDEGLTRRSSFVLYERVERQPKKYHGHPSIINFLGEQEVNIIILWVSKEWKKYFFG